MSRERARTGFAKVDSKAASKVDASSPARAASKSSQVSQVSAQAARSSSQVSLGSAQAASRRAAIRNADAGLSVKATLRVRTKRV
jgi:hypothetical protein